MARCRQSQPVVEQHVWLVTKTRARVRVVEPTHNNNQVATYSHYTKFQFTAPVATDALSVFDIFNLAFSSGATTDNATAATSRRGRRLAVRCCNNA